MRASSSTPSTPSSIAVTMRWKDCTAGTDLRSCTYEMPREELRLHVVLRLGDRPCAKRRMRLFVLAVAVLVAAEQVVELPVELALLRVVERAICVVVVLADALDDVGGLGQVRRELREPEQRLVELEVVRLVGDLGEDAVARLVELEAVERDREVVLRELLVALVVARLALVDAVESRAPRRSSSRRRRGASPARLVRSSDRR